MGTVLVVLDIQSPGGIKRLEEDAQLLGMVSRLVNSDRPEGLAEAADRFNAVIRALQELLK